EGPRSPRRKVGEGHAPVVRGDEGRVPGAEKSEMGDGGVRRVSIHGPVLQLRLVQVRDVEKRAGGPARVPGEDAPVRMAPGDGGAVFRYGKCRDGATLDSW